jgi:CBS domain containing-hemolysin-like protein
MDINWLHWLGFILSLCLTFLFSLFDISLSTSNRISLSRLLEDKEKSFRSRILKLYEELKISAGVLRIFFLLLFVLFLYLVFPHFQYRPLWLFVTGFGIYFLMFELLPHFITSLDNNKVLGLFFFRLNFLLWMTKPLSFFTHAKFFQRKADVEHEASDEEIQALIEEARDEGIIEKEEGPLIKSIVEFGDTIVREIMTPRVDMICIPRKEDIHTLRDLVIREKHSRIPVYRDRVDNIEGIVIAKDLLEFSADEYTHHPLDPLIREAYFVPETMNVSELLKEFQRRCQKLAIVVDEHGGVSGLVTMEDLMEEIVGEIQDEYDHEEVMILEEGPHDYIVFGDAEVDELDEMIGSKLAEDSFVTVGGFIIHHLGRLPKKGEKIHFGNLVIEILDVSQKKIKKLRIKKKPKPKE